jgi:hypothetical protein
MTRAAKELVIVLMVGAGALYVLWGATATREPLGGIGAPIREADWTAIGIGLGLILLATLLGFLVKPKKA